MEKSRVLDVIEDILDHLLSDLHVIQKNLHFWQMRAEVSYQLPLWVRGSEQCLLFNFCFDIFGTDSGVKCS